MAIVASIPTLYKVDLGKALHNFSASGGNSFKLALYTDAANLDDSSTVYTTSGEVVGTNYVAGGATLTNVEPISLTTKGLFTFGTVTFSNVTISAVRGCQIYNTSSSNKSVQNFRFSSDQAATAADFVVNFPVQDDSNSMQRLA